MKTDLKSQQRIDVVCKIRLRQLRAWKKLAIKRKISSKGCLRPEAYSSCSTAFRSYRNWWQRWLDQGNPPGEVVLWVMETSVDPNKGWQSLVARIGIRQFFVGGPEVPPELQSYVRSWTENEKFKESDCTVAKADPETSRFYPANNLGAVASRLRYVNNDGTLAKQSKGLMLRLHPDDAAQFTCAAEAIAGHTVFISYKFDDFRKECNVPRPRWTPNDLAEFLISRRLGVWLDSLCAPRRQKSKDGDDTEPDLTDDEVEWLLAEGHAQSQIVVAIDSQRYDTPGAKCINWTRREYNGEASKNHRSFPLRRFVLYGPAPHDLEPVPDCRMPWPERLSEKVTQRLEQLWMKTVP